MLGRTSPRFLQDVFCYDPANLPPSRFNVLTHIPPPYNDPATYPEVVSANSCRHKYVTKPNQTQVFANSQSIVPGAVYKVSAVCLICRYHLELAITYTTKNTQLHTHMHHLVHILSDPNQENNFRSKGQHLESYYFACSYATCSAHVSLRLLSPVLTSKWVNLLTDPTLLKQRADEAQKVYPERLEGLGRPMPITVLSNLRAYIENALHDKQRSRSISAANKRFIVCFGVEGIPCKDLLELLEFTFQVCSTTIKLYQNIREYLLFLSFFFFFFFTILSLAYS